MNKPRNRRTQIGILTREGLGFPNNDHPLHKSNQGILSPTSAKSLIGHGEIDRRSLRRARLSKDKKPGNTFTLRHGLPHSDYKMTFKLDLGGFVTFAVQKKAPYTVFHVKEHPASQATEVLQWHQRLRNKYVLGIHEAFLTNDTLYTMLEETAVSLETVIRCPLYPDEIQLSTTVQQVTRFALVDYTY